MIFAVQIRYAASELWSESTRYFYDNPVNPDFGLRTPGSGRWSGSSPKFIPLVPGPCPTSPGNFVKIHSQLFQLSDRQTNRQTNGPTDRSKNITPSSAEVTTKASEDQEIDIAEYDYDGPIILKAVAALGLESNQSVDSVPLLYCFCL